MNLSLKAVLNAAVSDLNEADNEVPALSAQERDCMIHEHIPTVLDKMGYGIQRRLIHAVNILSLFFLQCVEEDVKGVEQVLLCSSSPFFPSGSNAHAGHPARHPSESAVAPRGDINESGSKGRKVSLAVEEAHPQGGGMPLEMIGEVVHKFLSRPTTGPGLAAEDRCNPVLFFRALQPLCERPRLKEALGASALPSLLVRYVSDVPSHSQDGFEVSRLCASIIIELLHASNANKNRLSLLSARTVGLALVHSGDYYFQMQCAEILFRLHLHNPLVFLSQAGLPPMLHDGLEHLSNDVHLLSSIQVLLDLFNSEQEPRRIYHVSVAHLMAGGSEVSGNVSMYFGRHLLVVVLPSGTRNGEEETEAAEADAAEGVRHFTIPYEHIRSVKLSRDCRLGIRLHTIPEKLSQLMSLETEGRDMIHALLTMGALQALRSYGVHEWIMERKRTAPRRRPLPIRQPPPAPSSSLSSSSSSSSSTSPRELGNANNHPNAAFQHLSSRGGGHGCGDASSTKTTPHPTVGNSRSGSRSGGGAIAGVRRGREDDIEREDDVDASRSNHHHNDDDDYPYSSSDSRTTTTNGGPSASTSASSALLPSSVAQTGSNNRQAALQELEAAARRRTERYRQQRDEQLRQTRERVQMEIQDLHRRHHREREQLEVELQHDLAAVAQVEEAMKGSASSSIDVLNAELQEVQALGKSLVMESEQVRQRLAHALRQTEGVEESALERIKETVEKQVKDLQDTLHKMMTEAGPCHVIQEEMRRKR